MVAILLAGGGEAPLGRGPNASVAVRRAVPSRRKAAAAARHAGEAGQGR